MPVLTGIPWRLSGNRARVAVYDFWVDLISGVFRLKVVFPAVFS